MNALTLRLFSASVAIAGLVAAGSAQAQTAAPTVATPVAPAATTPAPAGAVSELPKKGPAVKTLASTAIVLAVEETKAFEARVRERADGHKEVA